jgi:hypothetical protein
MRILLLDIETSCNIAPVWGVWNPHIDVSKLIGSSYILCWSAKWLGDDNLMWKRSHGKDGRYRTGMLRAIHRLLDTADAVVHYNGSRFDIPTLNKEFLLHGMTRPAPYKEIDLLRVVRAQFRFTSNKLDYVCQQLLIGKKVKHRGLDLWLGCMNNNKGCWTEMEAYNKRDVVILEKLYHRLLPWLKTHTNYSLHTGSLVCPNCGSGKHQKRGFATTTGGCYQRFQCQECGAWFRGSKQVKKGVERMVSL